MPGAIVGVLGLQRSGKTLYSYLLVKMLKERYGVPVYTNIYAPADGFHWINSLEDFPLDTTPKVLFIDEVYNGTDAQDFRKLKDISIFINTIGKQNCLFVYTCIDPSTVYNRLRNQTNLVVCVKSDPNFIHYRIVNVSKNTHSDFSLLKSSELFENVYYDTQFIPLDFDWNMENWRGKLARFYRDLYGLHVKV